MPLIDLLRYLTALLLVLGLVAGAAFAIRRFGLGSAIGGAGRRLRIMETLSLGGKHRLVIVRCDNQEHLMVLTPAGATPVVAIASPAPDFVTHLTAEPVR